MSKTAESINTSAAWAPDRPYDALPPLPPAVELESRAVLKRCVAARSALAELRVAAALIPNPAVLINTLPLLEAQASSEIETVVTTADSAPANRRRSTCTASSLHTSCARCASDARCCS